MMAVPYYQVVEFLSWVSEQRRSTQSTSTNRDTLRRFALEYLRTRDRVDTLTLSRILQTFQICPMISDPDVRSQMRHFSSCGRCLHYIRQEHREYQRSERLHPFLEGFLRFYQSREEDVEIEIGNLGQDWAMRESADYLFQEYIARIGSRLLRSFEDYLDIVDRSLLHDYETRSRGGRRERPSQHERTVEEGTIPINAERGLEQEASRLVDSVYLLLEGQFYNKIRLEPQVYRFFAAIGLLLKDTAQGIEFLDWLQEKHPKVNLLGSLPTQELSILVSEFCEERNYANTKSFSQEVVKWLRGDVDKSILQRLIKIKGRSSRKSGMRNSAVSPFARYQAIPYHGIFLFLSAGDFPDFVRKYWEDLNYLTADWLDIYYSTEDLQRRVSGYEVLEQFRSIHLKPMSLPALLLWEQRLSDCCVVPLEKLTHDDIFDLMKLLVQEITDKKFLPDICSSAQVFVQQKPDIPISAPHIIIRGGFQMGDSYNVGQAGAVGANAQAHDITFNQIWSQASSSLDLPTLAQELTILRTKLKEEATEPEQDAAVGAIAAAEVEVKNGNGPKALEYLSKAGRWALDIATKIGVTVAAAAMKEALGIK